VRAFDTGERLDDHVQLIGHGGYLSVMDPEIQRIAVQIATGHVEQDRKGAFVELPTRRKVYRLTVPNPAGCASHDARCQLRAVFDFVRANVDYVPDPRRWDTFRVARATLVMGGGDCDDHAILFCGLLGSIGYRMGAEVISLDGKSWEHIYALAKVGREWVPLDTAAPEFAHVAEPGWRYPNPARRTQFEFVM
jgi:hypothetical protein